MAVWVAAAVAVAVHSALPLCTSGIPMWEGRGLSPSAARQRLTRIRLWDGRITITSYSRPHQMVLSGSGECLA